MKSPDLNHGIEAYGYLLLLLKMGRQSSTVNQVSYQQAHVNQAVN